VEEEPGIAHESELGLPIRVPLDVNSYSSWSATVGSGRDASRTPASDCNSSPTFADLYGYDVRGGEYDG
jgi:hypothetical protein